MTPRKRLLVVPERRAIWVGFYGVILLAWCVLVLMAPDQSEARSLPAEFWAGLCLAAADSQPMALWLMWAVMSAAMMLPTFVPALATFIEMKAARATNWGSASALVLGYIAVWLAASVFGAIGQIALARAGLLTPFGQSASLWLTAALLTAAGAYQFSALKHACLSKCRMPITYFLGHWKPGPVAAARMGIDLGLVCFGCCWALMALGFVGGTMNLIWMGAATAFMALEKLPDIGNRLTGPAGAALILAGGATALRALLF